MCVCPCASIELTELFPGVVKKLSHSKGQQAKSSYLSIRCNHPISLNLSWANTVCIRHYLTRSVDWEQFFSLFKEQPGQQSQWRGEGWKETIGSLRLELWFCYWKTSIRYCSVSQTSPVNPVVTLVWARTWSSSPEWFESGVLGLKYVKYGKLRRSFGLVFFPLLDKLGKPVPRHNTPPNVQSAI
jgi:hypothetical protein